MEIIGVKISDTCLEAAMKDAGVYSKIQFIQNFFSPLYSYITNSWEAFLEVWKFGGSGIPFSSVDRLRVLVFVVRDSKVYLTSTDVPQTSKYTLHSQHNACELPTDVTQSDWAKAYIRFANMARARGDSPDDAQNGYLLPSYSQKRNTI